MDRPRTAREAASVTYAANRLQNTVWLLVRTAMFDDVLWGRRESLAPGRCAGAMIARGHKSYEAVRTERVAASFVMVRVGQERMRRSRGEDKLARAFRCDRLPCRAHVPRPKNRGERGQV